MTPIEFLSSMVELYERRMAAVSSSFQLTATELSILLFLANNPEYDTAQEIVEKRHLTKSHVSLSLRSLEERGLIKKEHRDGNKRTLHLVLLPTCDKILQEGQREQGQFLSALTEGFSEAELHSLHLFEERIRQNVSAALGQEKKKEAQRKGDKHE